MKRISFLLIPLVVLSACGTDSRESKQTVNRQTPNPATEIQAQNRTTGTPQAAVNNSINAEIEKLTSQYERVQVVLEVKEVKDKIKIYVEGEDNDLTIDRKEGAPTYYVRIVPLPNEAKLMIDRFYVDGSHLSKEIPLKKGIQSSINEFIYESADNTTEKIELKDGISRMEAKSPSYKVIYKDGKWSAEYKEKEMTTDGFEKTLGLTEVKDALTKEGIDHTHIKKIKTYFYVQAESPKDKVAEEQR